MRNEAAGGLPLSLGGDRLPVDPVSTVCLPLKFSVLAKCSLPANANVLLLDLPICLLSLSVCLSVSLFAYLLLSLILQHSPVIFR